LFASISDIKAAMDEAARQKALWEARQPEEEAKRAAEAAARSSLEDMCIE
jgi:hypothetical protein